ncbi:MAG TPA: hypothetical protein PLI65_04075 [Bacteroidales bacterium]|nr:hypothetical protein [Bacteroidales bacterium]HPR56950.1 hypothetical protein [Bacteroidales bacterium]
MESTPANQTVIEVKRKFVPIVVNYLENKALIFRIVSSETSKTTKIQIDNLKSQDAFRLGVQVQVQLIDGEQLI